MQILKVIEQLHQYSDNYKNSCIQIQTEYKDNMKIMEKKRNNLIKNMDDFHNKCLKAEKAQQNLEKLINKSSKNHEELQKAADYSLSKQQEAQEQMLVYQKQIDETNEKWDVFKQNFTKVFKDYDINQESRIGICRQNMIQIMKIIQKNYENFYNHHKSVNYDLGSNKEQDDEKESCLKQICDTKQLENLNQFQEPFISFDMYKQKHNVQKNQDKNAQKFVEKRSLDLFIMNLFYQDIDGQQQNNDSNNNLNTSSEKDLNQLHLTSGKKKSSIELQQQQFQQVNLSDNISSFNQSQNSLQSSFLSPIKNDYTQSPLKKQVQNFQILKQEQKKQQLKGVNHLIDFQEVFSKQDLRIYFLKNVYQGLLTQNDNFFETLPQDKLHKFIDGFKMIFQILNQTYDCHSETFFYMLEILPKITYFNQLGQKEYLLTYLNQEFWMKTQRWENLFDLLFAKKFQEMKYNFEINKQQQEIQKKQEDQQQTQQQESGGFSKFLSRVFGDDTKPIIQFDDSDIPFMVLEEINNYLLVLNLRNMQYLMDLLINLAQKKNIKQDLLPNLLSKHESEKNLVIRNEIFGYKSKNIRFVKKMIAMTYDEKAIYCILKSMPYLEIKDNPFKLLSLSKEHYDKIRNKVYKQFLTSNYIEQNLLKNDINNRIKLWYNILDCDRIGIRYAQMKSEVSFNVELDKIENLITIDVNRSFHIHKSKLSSSILQSFLRTFAFYNKEISYCQGMNYLAGYLFILIRDEEKTYKIFSQILDHNKYLKNIFYTHFNQLKVLLYQLNRILNIFLPKLGEHFEKEKIHPHFYAASWLITVFSQTYQNSHDSYIVKVFWDYFLSEGFKGLFKCIIYLLKFNEEKLLQLNFDYILNLLGEIMRKGYLTMSYEQLKENSYPGLDNIKNEINQYRISQRVLDQLENEYNYFIKSLEQK
ncbi:Rab-GTPase-TBC domain [Pseudocohnilembus persalinus]|uniref:Rab-GTPase-TBC domain n=1 Tax=Pseudocohnilembus persalinus TaxID=266149 RepID=A0A0V0QBW8_PSEPJ|nr:Rab-GTPase-TBC domain [Pseudocohnilembus persalinus]|eukprot:KRW99726.1 Rab-GTPase-TBC domain [Pseudocohnilembus persalinus]